MNIKPTDAELTILNILWQKGPSTVREVHEAMNAERKTGYTTALKLLQIMADKGLVVRDETQRAHIYQARAPKEDTQKQLVGDLLNRVFEGSAKGLVIQALSSQKASPEEIQEIRKILDEYEEDAK